MEMIKTYSPDLFEKDIYDNWEKNGYFKAVIDKNKQPYCIVIPPPNITGQLHMGHALNNTLQDIMIRYKRMAGFSVLWQPGTDHASIATEVKIVEKMKKEGLSKDDVGRDGFLERAWEWKNKYGNKIVEQLKSLGSSCDWSREAFTMDEQCSKAVKKAFINMYNDKLIYRGDRIINWCTDCATALSDAEVDYEERDSFLWHIKYPIENSDEFIIIATTRPETMLGDTALAVNPKDIRYKSLVGKNAILPIINRRLPIVADNYVEKDFGSGVVKITPAHDPNDYEVGLRHNLEIIKVMNNDGAMNENAGEKYAGMDRFVCRKAIVEDLKSLGFMVKIEPYRHSVGMCYRCNTVVEPIMSKQWFVNMQPLSIPAIDIVKSGEIKITPIRFEKTYLNWMENIRDWCISRQLWWGHRIPAYYCSDCGNIMVSEDKPLKCDKCNSINIYQDEDVLDTWFSSALWPFSTLGYPDKSEFLDYYYPTDVLITAYDIIPFWVARMIFSGLYHMDKKPFDDVLIHGIVRDNEGRKMSKSLGNGIDPLEIINKYGADTLRFSLVMGISAGGDIKYSQEKVESCRNFMNKIWNASRYVLMNMDNAHIKDIKSIDKTVADKWILSRLQELVVSVSKNLDSFDMGLAAAKLYDFLWSDYCDWYIELSKTALYSGDDNLKNNSISVLVYVLSTVLKLLHPFVPFLTEKIMSFLDSSSISIMISDWPVYDDDLLFKNEEREFSYVMEIIKSIRNIRAEKQIPPSKKVAISIIANDSDKTLINGAISYINKLAGVDKINYIENSEQLDVLCVSAVTKIAELFIPLGELVDIAKERDRITAEIDKMDSELERSKKMLSNKGFLDRAPKALIDKEIEKQNNYKEIKEKLISQLESLQ